MGTKGNTMEVENSHVSIAKYLLFHELGLRKSFFLNNLKIIFTKTDR